MKTPYNEIVNIASIGSQTNPISLNESLRKANDEQLTPAAQNKERVLFLGIDVQQDWKKTERKPYAYGLTTVYRVHLVRHLKISLPT